MPAAFERLRRSPEPAPALTDWVLDALHEAVLLVDLGAPRQPVMLMNRAARGVFAHRDSDAPPDLGLEDLLSSSDVHSVVTWLAALGPDESATRFVRFRTHDGEFEALTECLGLEAPPRGGAGPAPRAAGRRLARRAAAWVLLKFAPDAQRAPAALSQALERAPLAELHALTERASDVILVADAQARIRYVSGGIANALGYTPDERLAGSLFDKIHPDERAELRALYARLVRGELPAFTREFRVQHKDGSYRWMHASHVAALDDPLIGGVVVNSRDVTERKRLEEELLVASSEERQRIGRDLHDGLGQELTGVALMLRGLARRLETRCPEAIAATNEAIGLVNQSINTARSLARGLLTVAADEGGLVTALRALAERGASLYGIEVRCDVAAGLRLPRAAGDANHLYRIAQEALTNAVRHGKARAVAIRLELDGERYRLTIADDGCGMPETPPAGAGLGLAIMAHRARLLAASLEFTANRPRGTCVRVLGMQRAATQV
jgi:PAS domain S-box-containing protein